MTQSLVGFEATLLMRDRASVWTVVSLALVMLLSLAGHAIGFARDDAAKSTVAAAERARWLNQGEKDPHSAAHYSVYAFKSAPPLAPLDSGIELYVGQTIWLEAHAQNDTLHRPNGDATLLQRIAALSPATLLATFGPLVIFVLAYTSIAQDRERGSWRLALGAAAHPWRLVAGKLFAVSGLAIVLLVVPLAVTALASASLGDKMSSDVGLRVGGWTLVSSAYLVVWACIGLAICLRASNPRWALAALFGVWVALTVASPRWISSWIEQRHPLPSSQAVREELARDAAAYWTAEEGQEHLQTLLKRYGVSRGEDLPVDARGAELDMVERHSHQVFDRVLGGLYDQVESQDRRFATWAWLTPTIALQTLSNVLAGTDFSHHRQFLGHAERYRRDLVNRMNADVMANPANHAGPRHKNSRALWEEIPEYVHQPPSLVWTKTLSAASLPLVVWLLAALSALGLAVRGVRP